MSSENKNLKFEELGYVFKRNGAKVPFDIEKIVNAIKAAGVETKEFDEEEARHLAFIVKKILTQQRLLIVILKYMKFLM